MKKKKWNWISISNHTIKLILDKDFTSKEKLQHFEDILWLRIEKDFINKIKKHKSQSIQFYYTAIKNYVNQKTL